VECIARAKTLQLNLTGTIWMIGNEKLCEGNLSTSLLEGSIGSDAAQTFMIDRILFQIAATVQKRTENRIDLPVLGLAGCHDGKRNGNKTELK